MATYTQEQYEALTEAIATGALSVSYAGKTVTYRSLEEMRSILQDMEVQLGISGGTVRVFGKFSKGFQHDVKKDNP